ncbi:MAG TPA: hypothetical protein PKK48_06550, partial [Phycisphaerae bacterium]|nr:hypothetical protein [Phycisphaerae bacterium]
MKFATILQTAAVVTFLVATLMAGCDDGQPSQIAAAKPADVAASQPQVAPKVVAEQYLVTSPDIQAVRLSNGMYVIAKAVRKAPVVCVCACVKAGGIYEGK